VKLHGGVLRDGGSIVVVASGRFFVGVGGGFQGGPSGGFVVVDLYPNPYLDLLGVRFTVAIVQIRGG